MKRHKYPVGATVYYHTTLRDMAMNHGLYTVSRHLPEQSGNFQYRIRNKNDNHERVVQETELRDPGLPPPASDYFTQRR